MLPMFVFAAIPEEPEGFSKQSEGGNVKRTDHSEGESVKRTEPEPQEGDKPEESGSDS